MRPVVHLHIGAPKTGTTHLQDRLTLNRRSLARHGVLVPTVSPLVSPGLAHFRAALDLLEMEWPGAVGRADGSWDRLVRRARAARGTVLISHEALATARPDTVARAMRDLDGCEVHVVYTARDLSRQLASAWQESIKLGRTWPFRAFLRRAREHRLGFMRAFDLPEVLRTWGEGLPAGRLHLVTVPHPSAGPGTLWLRFCDAVGVDPAWAPREAARTNDSLGSVDTQLLRRLNQRSDGRLRPDVPRGRYVETLVTQGGLGRRQAVPVVLPPGDLPWVRAEADGWLTWLEGRDVVVHGDLQDLLPPAPSADQVWTDPDRVSDREVLDAALDALHDVARGGGQHRVRDRLLARARANPVTRRFT